MTKDEHKAIHLELHSALDQLFADYILHHPDQGSFLNMPLIDLIKWSYEQTIDPDELHDSSVVYKDTEYRVTLADTMGEDNDDDKRPNKT